MLGLDGIQGASFSRIGPRASVRSSRLTTIGLSRRFHAGSNAAADNYRIGNARSSFHGGLFRTRVRLPPPPPNFLALFSIVWTSGPNVSVQVSPCAKRCIKGGAAPFPQRESRGSRHKRRGGV